MSYKAKIQTAVTDNPPQPNEWELRDKQIYQMAKAYLESFKFGMLWRQAEQGNWDIHLWRYVHAVASIQAEVITGAKVGFNSGILWGFTKIPDERAVREYMDEQRRLCADGRIDVRIPSERIEEFKKNPIARDAFFMRAALPVAA